MGISDHDWRSFPIRFLFHNDIVFTYVGTRKMKSGNKNFPFGMMIEFPIFFFFFVCNILSGTDAMKIYKY